MEENNENVQLSEKEARKKRLRERRMARRAKHNARIARCRLLKNIFIWFLGVIFLPIALVGVSFVVPISVITGNNGEYVSEDLSNKSLFEAVKFVAGNYSELGFSDFPIIGQKLAELENTDIGDGKTLGDVVDIDTDKLNAIKFGEEGMADKVRDCVEVIATLDSVGGTDMLGDFGTLNVFNDAEEVDTLENIDTTAADFDAKQYYYKTAGDEYLRAFNDDGTFVDGLNGSETVYYPPLAKVRISELVNIMDDAFGRLKIASLLETFHASNETLIQILGENTTVKGLSNFEEILDDVALTVVLPVEGNTEIYDILRSATNKTNNDDITIGLLKDTENGFKIDNIALTSVLPVAGNTEIYDILRSATNKTNNDDITIGLLQDTENGFKIDNITLTSVLGEYGSANEQLYDILSSATGKEPAAITIGDLTGNDFNINDIKLEDVFERITDTENENYAKNKQLWDILDAAITPSTINDETAIRVKDFNTFDVNGITLTTILPAEDNADLYKVLRSATNRTNDQITLAVLSDSTIFKISNIALTSVLPAEDNADLYKILRSATNKTNDQITLAVLSDSTVFSINNITLTSVLGEYGSTNKQLYDILSSATGKTPAAITIGDLSGDGFNINNIKLEDVFERITDTENANYEQNHQLWTILEAAITPSTVNEETAIRVKDFNTFDAGSIYLTTVLPYTGNDKLYSVLVDLAPASAEITEASQLQIKHMNGLTITDIHLNIFFGYSENERLYNILLDGIPASWGITSPQDITIGSMSDFDPDKIKLSTVVGATPTNSILKALVDSGTTLENIATNINDIAITEIFTAECFTDNVANAVDTYAKYRKENGVYTLDTVNGTYYVSKNAKVWLFVLYNGSGMSNDTTNNTHGAMTTYTPVNVKLYGNGGTDVGLQARMEDVSGTFVSATIRQLVETGMLTENSPGDYSNLYDKSFEEILILMNNPAVIAAIAGL